MQIICNICLKHIGIKEAVSLAVCGHVFDLTCILHCLQVSKKCPTCKQEVFGTTRQEQFIKMYFSTDDSDEKATRMLENKMNAAAAEIRLLKSKIGDYQDLAARYEDAQEELKSARELVSLLHEEYNTLKSEANMAKMDQIRRQE